MKIIAFGRITNEPYVGWTAKILDDNEETGGYYLLCASSTNSSIGFDNWFASIEELKDSLPTLDYKIEWNTEM